MMVDPNPNSESSSLSKREFIVCVDYRLSVRGTTGMKGLWEELKFNNAECHKVRLTSLFYHFSHSEFLCKTF